METYLMIIGFTLAAYSVIGNDSIQTLGTFLSSNSKRPWYILWLFAGSIMFIVLVVGWYSYGGDVSYGRLQKVGDLPNPFHWWYILPPLVLMVITRFGIPVSTTFLIISVFNDKVITDMLLKSGSGYILAFVTSLLTYYFIAERLEKNVFSKPMPKEQEKLWVFLQWSTTAFLWAQWLIQDLANIYVYLPRTMNYYYLSFSVVVLLAIQGFILYSKGGEIQKVVTEKTNTGDIRSATIIDFLFGMILLFFKEYSNLPMSTTWVFIGLLAGREIMVGQAMQSRKLKNIRNLVLRDLGKVFLGVIVSVLLVLLIRLLK